MATSIADHRVGHPGERVARPYWNPYLAGFALGLVLQWRSRNRGRTGPTSIT